MIWGAVLLIFICTAIMVVKRNQVYASPSTLWADTFKKSPNKLSIGKTLSIHYLMEEDYANALTPLKALLQINPHLYDVLFGFVRNQVEEDCKEQAESE